MNAGEQLALLWDIIYETLDYTDYRRIEKRFQEAIQEKER